MGCAPVAAFAVAYPDMVASLVLYWPVGGAKYRISSHQRFAEHIAFVRDNRLERVVALVRAEGKPFGADPRGGPWASAIKRDADFAATYARQDPKQYIATCESMRDALFDRDTAPGRVPAAIQLLGRRRRGADRSGDEFRACSNFCAACSYDESMGAVRVRLGCFPVHHRRGPDDRVPADRGRKPRGSAAVRRRFAGRASE